MYPPPLASVEQLAVRLGRDLDGADAKRAEAVLEDVSAAARGVSKQEWLNSAEVPGDVVGAVLAAARRLFTNPDGFVQQSLGPFANTRAAATVTADVFLASELAVLKRALPRKPLWTLSTTRGDADYETGFAHTEGFSDPFPLTASGDPGFEQSYHFPGA